MRMNLKNKCQTTYYMFRGGGTDFSWGGGGGGEQGYVMARRTQTRGVWGHAPQEMFINIDAIRSILGKFWHYLYPARM